MARNDFRIFNVAEAKALDGDWASTDHFYAAICDNTTTPAAGTTTPTLSDFTEVGSAGTYPAGGYDLGTWGSMVSETAGVVTIDSTVNPSCAADPANDVDAYWVIIYNFTDAAHDALGFLDLGGPVDMTAGALTFTWNVNGLATIQRPA